MTVNILDRALNCDVAVLNSLAHAGWLNTWQLQALCFPGYTVSTVRLRLRYLAEAHWIRHVHWRVGRGDGGRVWSITPRGLTVLERFITIQASSSILDYGRPASPLEQEEWLAQLAIRTFVVRLVLEARQRPVLANLTLTLPGHGFPAMLDAPILHPDGILAISWRNPVVQRAEWLPWPSTLNNGDGVTQYRVFLDRPGDVTNIVRSIDSPRSDCRDRTCYSILILQSEERCVLAQSKLRGLSSARMIRLTSWPALETSIVRGGWRDSMGCRDTLEQEAFT